MSTPEGKTPEHEAIYQRVREMILFGEVEPGQPLTIQGLTRAIDAGMTPVREAIRRLTAEGALEALGNRRLCVPELSVALLEEVYFVRLILEPKITQIAANKAPGSLVSDLRAIDDKLNHAIEAGDIQGYLRHNYRFHTRLYQHAETPILHKIADTLWLRVGPSLRVVCGRYGTSNLPDKHEEAMGALMEGDARRAGQAIEGDIRQGMEQVRQALVFK